jgi:hypothetical protein
LVADQNFKCPLCSGSLRGTGRGGPVLDHDHATGFVREALCRVCNAGEGKVKGLAVRFGGGTDSHVSWLKKLALYWEKHTTPQTPYIHPTHLTEDEKRLKKNATARKKRVVSKAASAAGKGK